jgi:hypothetical protein
MKKKLAVIIILVGLIGCNNNELEKLKSENAQLKSENTQLRSEIAKLKETDDFHYKLGVDYLNQKNWAQAKTEFLTVIQKYPQSKLILDAKKGLAKDEDAILSEEKAKKAAELKAERERERIERLKGIPIDYVTFYVKAQSVGLPVGKRFRISACIERNAGAFFLCDPGCPLPCNHLMSNVYKNLDSDSDNIAAFESFLARVGDKKETVDLTVSIGFDGTIYVHRIGE